jgi:hypothetical protein
MSWVHRLKPVFDIDIEACRVFGGTLKVIGCIEDLKVSQYPVNDRRILDASDDCHAG